MPGLQKTDPESQACLSQMTKQEAILGNRVSGVKFVLIVLSARGIVFDQEALRQKVMLSYPDAAVFFQTTYGQAVGLEAPSRVDLLIDFTGPGQRQRWFFSRSLRKKARFAVGRNAGMFRRRIYDRIFDESVESGIPTELLERERYVQKKVLSLAGVAMVPAGETPPDRGKTIALELPRMKKL
ncbi:MAG: hypothetical protein HYX41_08070 [Bdellovibrio sp.]|nr:hypothetical protein [Bdellovibrio sp.]